MDNQKDIWEIIKRNSKVIRDFLIIIIGINPIIASYYVFQIEFPLSLIGFLCVAVGILTILSGLQELSKDIS